MKSRWLVLLRALLCAVLYVGVIFPRPADCRTSNVVVTALDSTTHAPTPHVHVHMESDVASYDGFTDASGRATFEGIRPARYIVSLDKPNYSFGMPAEYTIEQGAVLSRDEVTTRALNRLGHAALGGLPLAAKRASR